MKEMNRREFLTLTGAAVVALSLAGCGGAPSAPTPSNDIRVQQALDALNQFRRDKGLTELVYEKELEELTDLLISPFVKEGKPVVDRTKFSSYVDVKEDEIKQALSNKGYPIYETYFTAGLGPGRNGQIEDLEIPHRRGAETELADLYVGRHQHGGKKPTLLCHVGAQHRR